MANILILSGDRQQAKHAADYLKLKGYDVSAHTDPQQAILKADTKSPTLVVIDLLLAGHSGVEFLYELRSYPEWQDVPVIVTGQQLQSDIQAFMPALTQLNVANYLPMPLTSLAQLESAVQNLLQPVAA